MKKNKRETTVDSTNETKVVTKEQYDSLLEKYNELEESYKSVKHSITAYKSANTKYRNVCESLVKQRDSILDERNAFANELADEKIKNTELAKELDKSTKSLETARDSIKTAKEQIDLMSSNNKGLSDKVCELMDAIEKYNETPWIKRIFQKVQYNK